MSTDETTDQTDNSEDNSAEAASGADAGKTEATGQETAKSPETVSREAYQALQSKADKAAADARRAREEAEKAVNDAIRARREAEVANLTPEDRTALQKSWNLEDRERRLQAQERDAEETAKELAIAKLTLDNGLDAEARKELEGIDDVNEMRARAAELKVARLQKELDEAKTAGASSEKAKGEEQKPAPKGMRGDPAGSGSGGQTSYDPKKFKGTGDLAGALRAQREAGEVKYEAIPVRNG